MGLKIRLKKSDINPTIESTDKINRFFGENKLPLEARGYKISTIKDPLEFIEEALEKDFDVWVEFANKPIFRTDGGHDCLVSEIRRRGTQYFAVLIDPYWRHKQMYEVPFDDLIEAMQKKKNLKPIRERGIVIVKEK